MANEFGIKELYSVSLKTTYPIEMNGRTIQKDETIAVFDKIQIANFQEIARTAKASGGYQNQSLIYWKSVESVQIDFAQGIFSKPQLALLTNSKLVNSSTNKIEINQRDYLESDENGIVHTTKSVFSKLFIYDKATGAPITFTTQSSTDYKIDKTFCDVIVDYNYQYENSYQVLTVGQELISGFLSLEGRTRVKDDVTGQTHTGIFKIPKIRLMSGLSMRLGEDAVPLVGRFSAQGLPTGDRNNTSVMQLYFLDDDIDSDM